uniref:Uncharacterized protein n=1 Tax=Arcella intermedia TaxID=1963864 RepID=A0A6B2LW22_9EUKA
MRTDAASLLRMTSQNLLPISNQLGLQRAQEIHAVNYMECSALGMWGVKEVFGEAIRAVLLKNSKPPKKLHGGCVLF